MTVSWYCHLALFGVRNLHALATYNTIPFETREGLDVGEGAYGTPRGELWLILGNRYWSSCDRQDPRGQGGRTLSTTLESGQVRTRVLCQQAGLSLCFSFTLYSFVIYCYCRYFVRLDSEPLAL
ncbi:hypothetical protein SCLCIDRAFT_1215770 [Scleroderma citrinum Foug A]|uniref:Uncharacterized protein n=1 Tax=Scleroderma citrinum Foug A TaxID=1036808 RepID=A0A0C3DZP4_9AGAM|nr:hypothetical protein SCLCIDRAFT_1215770 [Scleroderma citrinum Foug A]